MPLRYECYGCGKIFGYTDVEVDIDHRDAGYHPDRYIKVIISCEHSTRNTLGTGQKDYVCGDCIEKAIKKKGLN